MIFRWLLFFLALTAVVGAGELGVRIEHRFAGKRLFLDSLRYETSGSETFSITRASYLLSGFALRDTSGGWIEIPGAFAWGDVTSRRDRFRLQEISEGSYDAIRFSVGLDEETNHSNATEYTADHSLNPNLNRLHWTWQDGYIFLAVEGRYRKREGEVSGFVYHLANDQNRTAIEITFPRVLSLGKGAVGIGIAFDFQRLLNGPRPITFETSGDSTHSHEGDPLAEALKTNLTSAFSLISTSVEPLGNQAPPPKPLYLPESPEGYLFKMAASFPMPALPLDNPLLKGRVALGRKLFHDASLSRTGRISCSSCHLQEYAFSDPRQFSLGVDGISGRFHSMPLFNLAWKSSFFWDGRAKSLREQVLEPIQDHREMGETLENVTQKVAEKYPAEIERAFGAGAATPEKIALALESFLLTLTSYDSKFDRAVRGEEKLGKDEQRGFELFFTEYEPRSNKFGADCFHCHGGALFTDHGFHDNGLGGKFATPSLRNIALTAPYMHDGRFESLYEVVDHYMTGIESSKTLSQELKTPIKLSHKQKVELVAFLKTLTDYEFLRNPKFQFPKADTN